MKTLYRNQITAVKFSGKQHKGAENCFEVHFSGVPGSPWVLSAPSKVTVQRLVYTYILLAYIIAKSAQLVVSCKIYIGGVAAYV